MIHGTSWIEYGPSDAPSSSIVAATCFSRMRNSPITVLWFFSAFSLSVRPVDTSVA